MQLSSRIQRGTEPAAGLLCALSKEFDDLLLVSAERELRLKGFQSSSR
ncbi:MAG: hypothetical protein J7L98_03705 [Candidatus Verstraetearchaeota archaeon]|nr:hypothetical protein [Candidatus Verstraetearchaeota archaeon]